MKRNAIALACTALIAAAVFLPLSQQGAPSPQDALPASQPAIAANGDAGSAGEPQAADVAAEGAVGEYAIEEENGRQCEKGAVLVSLRDDMSIEQINGRLASLDYVSTKTVSESDVEMGYAKLSLADGVSVGEAQRLLASEEFATAAQPNYIYRLMDDGASAPQPASAQGAAVPTQGQSDLRAALIAQATSVNDPYFKNGSQWGLEAVKAPEAWDEAKVEGSVTVAVLDSGLNSNQEDFDSSRIVEKYNCTSDNRFDISDSSGHGTRVASVIAATTNNDKGIAGVSYNAKIMPVKVAVGMQSDTDKMKRGLEQVLLKASAENVRVVNISLGSDSDSSHDTQLNNTLKKIHDQNILVVYAAGNGGETGAYNCEPCDYDYDEGAIGVINVARSGSSYARHKSSNYNLGGQRTKELAAPGCDIYSIGVDGKYSTATGTSFAAPFVSGIAALMFAKDPNLTAAQARNALCNTAQDLGATGWDNQTGYGLVNAYSALTGKPTPPSSDTIDLANASITLSQSTYTFTGAACEPTVTVKVNGETLSRGTSYTVRYANNVNAGTATVTITGTGSCKGTRSVSFTIKKAPLTSMALTKSKFAYDGTTKSPASSVKGPKKGVPNSTLARGTDYTLTIPAGRTAVGTYTYAAMGKGNYTGKVTVKLTITKAKNTMKVKNAKKTVKASELKKSKKTVKPLTVKNAKGKVTYKKLSGAKCLTVNAKKGTVTVKKGTAKKTYSMKVRITAAGNKSYKNLVKTVTVKVKVA